MNLANALKNKTKFAFSLIFSYITMSLFEITKMRYLKVFYSMREDYVGKSLVSALLYILAVLGSIFESHVELITLLFIAIIVDWVTGHMKAFRTGTAILSIGWRQTVVKIVEYALFLAVLTGMSNVFGNADFDGWIAGVLNVFKNIDWFGYFYLTLTELKSISENVSGGSGPIAKAMEYIRKKFSNENFDI